MDNGGGSELYLCALYFKADNEFDVVTEDPQLWNIYRGLVDSIRGFVFDSFPYSS